MNAGLWLQRRLAALRLQLRSVLHRRRVEDELARELRFHLDQQADEHQAHGMTREAAERAARRELGALGPLAETVRDEWHVRFLDELGQDLRFGARALIRTPVLTLAAVGTLSIGIGATSSLFGLLDQTIFRTLAVPKPDQLFAVTRARANGSSESVPYPLFVALASERTAGHLAGYAFRTAALAGPTDSAVVQLTSGAWFATVGVSPRRGRQWSEGEGRELAIISDRFWAEHFARAASALGATVRLAGTSYAVIGVMPPGFTGISLDYPVDVWVPIEAQPLFDGTSNLDGEAARGANWVRVVTRIAPPATAQNAQQGAALVFARTRRAAIVVADSNEHLAVTSASRPAARDRDGIAHSLLLATVLVAFVLLIACANIANLQFARGITRQRELGIRLAMGAGRARVVRQLMTESGMLALLSGALGIWLAFAINRALAAFTMAELGRSLGPLFSSAGAERVLIFTLLLAVASAVSFGLAPALRSTRLDLTGTLRQSALAGGGSTRGGLRSWLLAAQMALSILLLLSAGMVALGLRNAVSLDLGFEPRNVAQLTVDWRGVSDTASRMASEDIAAALRAMPGVQAASVSVPSAYGRATVSTVAILGAGDPNPGQHSVEVQSVSPEFFATMRLRQMSGRTFTTEDRAGAPNVVVLNQAASRLLFPGIDAMGRRFEFMGRGHLVEVVGIVGDSRLHSVLSAPPPLVYVPFVQDLGGPSPGLRTIVVRSDVGASLGAMAEVATTRSLGHSVHLQPVTDLIHSSLAAERLGAWTTGALGVVGMLLAMLGAYGLHAFFVLRRTAELAVRLALGATAAQLRWLVWRQAMRPVVYGMTIGLSVAWVSTQLLKGRILGLTALAPSVVVAITLLMAVVASLACYLPARHASRLDPAAAMRAE